MLSIPMMLHQNIGADSLRLYEMFMGPLDVTKPWDEKGVKGVFGFLGRAFRFFSNPENILKVKKIRRYLKDFIRQ